MGPFSSWFLTLFACELLFLIALEALDWWEGHSLIHRTKPPTYLFPMVRERSEAKDGGISDGATPVYAAAMTLGK